MENYKLVNTCCAAFCGCKLNNCIKHCQTSILLEVLVEVLETILIIFLRYK
jgi:hypothetical protein